LFVALVVLLATGASSCARVRLPAAFGNYETRAFYVVLRRSKSACWTMRSEFGRSTELAG
jgi:hypothetical protein